MRKQSKKGQASKRSKADTSPTGDNGATLSPERKRTRLTRKKAKEDSQSQEIRDGTEKDNTSKKLIPTFGIKKASAGSITKHPSTVLEQKQEEDGPESQERKQVSGVYKQNSTSVKVNEEGPAPVCVTKYDIKEVETSRSTHDSTGAVSEPNEMDKSDVNKDETKLMDVNKQQLLQIFNKKHESKEVFKKDESSSPSCLLEAAETDKHKQGEVKSHQTVDKQSSSKLENVKEGLDEDDDGKAGISERHAEQQIIKDGHLSKANDEQDKCNIVCQFKDIAGGTTLLSTVTINGDGRSTDTNNIKSPDALSTHSAQIQTAETDSEKSAAKNSTDQGADVNSTLASGGEDGRIQMQEDEPEGTDVINSEASGVLSSEMTSEMSVTRCDGSKELPLHDEKRNGDVMKEEKKLEEIEVVCVRKEANYESNGEITGGTEESDINVSVTGEVSVSKSDDTNIIIKQVTQAPEEIKGGINDPQSDIPEDKDQVEVLPEGEGDNVGNRTAGLGKVCEPVEGKVDVQGLSEIQPEDDDLMDFTYSQACQMEEQCLATTDAEKVMSKSVNGTIISNMSVPPVVNLLNRNIMQPTEICSTSKQRAQKASGLTVPSPSPDDKQSGTLLSNLPCGPSMNLRSEDLEASAVVKGIIGELRGLNQMIMGAKKQIEAARRQQPVKLKQQQYSGKQQMRQQKLLPSGTKQLGSYRSLQMHKDMPYDASNRSRMLPPKK